MSQEEESSREAPAEESPEISPVADAPEPEQVDTPCTIFPHRTEATSMEAPPTEESPETAPFTRPHRPEATSQSRPPIACRGVSFGENVEARDKASTPTIKRFFDEEEGDDNVVQPELFRMRRQDSAVSALESFRQSFRRAESISTMHDDYNRPDRWKPWRSWSQLRFRETALGCFSSAAVLSIRLWLDREPTAYLIHSVVVFLDMILIHLFTNSPWLSVSGEIVTILAFLAFHITKETLFELLETTCIAILASFHMIVSRNKYKDRNKVLQHDFDELQQQTVILLRNMDVLEEEDLHDLEQDVLHHSTRTLPGVRASWLGLDSEHYKRKLKIVGDRFFEHFLDGSAGVMYTSFLGLIISELLRYGQEKSY